MAVDVSEAICALSKRAICPGVIAAAVAADGPFENALRPTTVNALSCALQNAFQSPAVSEATWTLLILASWAVVSAAACVGVNSAVSAGLKNNEVDVEVTPPNAATGKAEI